MSNLFFFYSLGVLLAVWGELCVLECFSMAWASYPGQTLLRKQHPAEFSITHNEFRATSFTETRDDLARNANVLEPPFFKIGGTNNRKMLLIVMLLFVLRRATKQRTCAVRFRNSSYVFLNYQMCLLSAGSKFGHPQTASITYQFTDCVLGILTW